MASASDLTAATDGYGFIAQGRPIELVLSRLERVCGKSSDTWMARCPAHNDRTPSLSIRERADGAVLLHCFAECETDDVVEAIGLRCVTFTAIRAM